jgi:hypothetical protein
VVVALNGPTALAATTSADGQVAGRVLDALALTPFNDLPPHDWTAFAEQRLGQMAAGERQAFAGLRGESSHFAQMAPEEAARTLAALLVPGYDGGRGIDEAQWTAEIEAQRASVPNAPSDPRGLRRTARRFDATLRLRDAQPGLPVGSRPCAARDVRHRRPRPLLADGGRRCVEHRNCGPSGCPLFRGGLPAFRAGPRPR